MYRVGRASSTLDIHWDAYCNGENLLPDVSNSLNNLCHDPSLVASMLCRRPTYLAFDHFMDRSIKLLKCTMSYKDIYECRTIGPLDRTKITNKEANNNINRKFMNYN